MNFQASKSSLPLKKKRILSPFHVKASQKFSESQKKVLSKFSSFNYYPTHSLLYKEWLGKHPPK